MTCQRYRQITSDFQVYTVLNVNESVIAGNCENNGVSICLWNVDNGIKLATVRRQSNTVLNLKSSPGLTKIASGSFDKSIAIFDFKTFQFQRTFDESSKAFLVEFINENLLASVAINSREIRVWNLTTLSPNYISLLHEYDIEYFILFKNGLNIGSSDKNNKIVIWNINLWTINKTLNFGAMKFIQIDDLNFAYLDTNSKLGKFNIQNSNPNLALTSSTYDSIEFLNNDKIAVGSASNDIEIWQYSTLNLLCSFRSAHGSTIYTIVYMPKLKYFISSNSSSSTTTTTIATTTTILTSYDTSSGFSSTNTTTTTTTELSSTSTTINTTRATTELPTTSTTTTTTELSSTSTTAITIKTTTTAELLSTSTIKATILSSSSYDTISGFSATTTTTESHSTTTTTTLTSRSYNSIGLFSKEITLSNTINSTTSYYYINQSKTLSLLSETSDLSQANAYTTKSSLFQISISTDSTSGKYL